MKVGENKTLYVMLRNQKLFMIYNYEILKLDI